MRNRERPPWWRVVDWRVVAAVGLPVWAVAAGWVLIWSQAGSVTAQPPTYSPPPGPPPARPTEFVGPPKPPPVSLPAGPLLWLHLPHAAAGPNRSPAMPAPDLLLAAAVRAQVRRAEAAAPPPAAEPGPPAKAGPPAEIDGCKTFGTFVAWRPSPAEAMKRAKEADKLVFVLHLSGNIEDDGFT